MDPVALFRNALGSDPDPWQTGVLRSTSPRVLLNCSRQSGKSTCTAVIALHRAMYHDGSLVLLLSPTLRQSSELFRKVMVAYRNLGRPVAAESETALSLTLTNGSRVVSLPGIEETVRGYSGVNLLVIDEAARVSDDLYYSVRPMLAVSGGRLMCLSTPFGRQGFFWKEWAEGGDYWERVRVTAQECPRISRAFLEEEKRTHSETWFNQEYGCEFLSGADDPLFPEAWLDRARELAEQLRGQRRYAKALGVDSAEGGDSSAWAVVDDRGLIHLLSLKTPDTTVIVNRTLQLMREYVIPAENVAFDRGGGGRQHADRLRAMGYPVRTVFFGERADRGPRRPGRVVPFGERVEEQEEASIFRNRRAQMYWELSELLDPQMPGNGFAIDFGAGEECRELRRQMSIIPKKWDMESRFFVPPKNKRSENSTERSLVEILGRSPDELDAVVLACFAMRHKTPRSRAGTIG